MSLRAFASRESRSLRAMIFIILTNAEPASLQFLILEDSGWSRIILQTGKANGRTHANHK